jgi:hypothetical protein
MKLYYISIASANGIGYSPNEENKLYTSEEIAYKHMLKETPDLVKLDIPESGDGVIYNYKSDKTKNYYLLTIVALEVIE